MEWNEMAFEKKKKNRKKEKKKKNRRAFVLCKYRVALG